MMFHATIDNCRYVSTLVVRFTEFDERPVIPIMFMIHERKTKSSNQHHFFWQKAVEYLPELEEATNIYIGINFCFPSNLISFILYNHFV